MEDCARCRFYIGTPDYGPEAMGECRRYAPHVLSHSATRGERRSARNVSRFTVWPMVMGTDWCGDYRPTLGEALRPGGGDEVPEDDTVG